MKRFVVDTNVPIVANGRGHGARPSLDCRLSAIDFLDDLLKNGLVLLDMAGEIQNEYRRHLSPVGQPGVGDRFYQVILQSGPSRVERVDLPKRTDNSFENFPNDSALDAFDPSDRKFVALAKRTKAPIAVATDSDWTNGKLQLKKNGVKISFLCGCDTDQWFEK